MHANLDLIYLQRNMEFRILFLLRAFRYSSSRKIILSLTQKLNKLRQEDMNKIKKQINSSTFPWWWAIFITAGSSPSPTPFQSIRCMSCILDTLWDFQRNWCKVNIRSISLLPLWKVQCTLRRACLTQFDLSFLTPQLADFLKDTQERLISRCYHWNHLFWNKEWQDHLFICCLIT